MNFLSASAQSARKPLSYISISIFPTRHRESVFEYSFIPPWQKPLHIELYTQAVFVEDRAKEPCDLPGNAQKGEAIMSTQRPQAKLLRLSTLLGLTLAVSLWAGAAAQAVNISALEIFNNGSEPGFEWQFGTASVEPTSGKKVTESAGDSGFDLSDAGLSYTGGAPASNGPPMQPFFNDHSMELDPAKNGAYDVFEQFEVPFDYEEYEEAVKVTDPNFKVSSRDEDKKVGLIFETHSLRPGEQVSVGLYDTTGEQFPVFEFWYTSTSGFHWSNESDEENPVEVNLTPADANFLNGQVYLLLEIAINPFGELSPSAFVFDGYDPDGGGGLYTNETAVAFTNSGLAFTTPEATTYQTLFGASAHVPSLSPVGFGVLIALLLGVGRLRLRRGTGRAAGLPIRERA